LLLSLFLGCLINTDLYEQRKAELLDEDSDGYQDILEGGDDCDDLDALVFPGAVETPYDGIDQDCDGEDLSDLDGDGAIGPPGVGADCDDDSASTFPGAPDACYDGVDADCAEDDDDDCDRDGFATLAAGGGDCDDTDPLVSPGAPDDCYDSLDADCAEDDDNDCDRDGHTALATGGSDCDDSDPNSFPDAPESWADTRTDNDCDGTLSDPVNSRLSEVATLITPPSSAIRFGNAVGSLPDLDGDGEAEMWITAPYEGGHAPYLGALYVLGGAALTPGIDVTVSEASLRGTVEGELLGTSVSLGDADADGEPELYVGSIGRNGSAGVVYGLPVAELGSAVGADPATLASSSFVGSEGAYLGTKVVADRDFDGDGAHDVLIEASGAGALALFVSPGSGDYTLQEADITWMAEPGRWLNTTALDDVDGDGVSDLGIVQGNTPSGTVGSALFRGGTELSGGTFPVGAHLGFVDTPTFGTFVETPWEDRVLVMLQWQASAFLSVEAGATYDVYADADWQVFRDASEGGFTDVVYGPMGAAGGSFLFTAPYSPTEGQTGACVVWSRMDWMPSIFASELPLAVVGDLAGDRACRSVAQVEDEDGDGELDLLVGADGAGPDEQGRAYLLLAP
jgi:hypothetical protein